jgi:hypothetical protein
LSTPGLRPVLPVLLGVVLAGAASGAGAQLVDVTVPAERDTTVMQVHARDNDGAWGYLWVKWNGAKLENRVLLGFGLAPLAGRAADVVSAKIELRAAREWLPRRGTRFVIHAAEPGMPEWIEGDGRFDTFAYCSRRDLRRRPTGPGGPGVTWTCEDDAGAGTDDGGEPTCAPRSAESPWIGGLPPQPESSSEATRGFRGVASESRLEFWSGFARCRKALACYAETGSLDCWRRFEFDVTADVRGMLAAGRHVASWLVRKERVELGALRFFSREGAACIMGIPELGPELVVTLVERPGDPPYVERPPDHCETSQ